MFSPEWRFRDCPWCGVKDAAFMQLTPPQRADRPLGTGEVQSRWWTMMSCPRCAKVVVVESNAPNEGPAKLGEIIPSAPSGPEVEHLPPDVLRHYEAAQRVLAAGEADLAAVALRRTIEAAAHHKGIDENVLVKSVQKMVDDGLITAEFHNVLDHIRKIGNVGAHAGSPNLGDHEVRRALRFTTQVLRNLFEIPAVLAEIDAEAQAESSGDDS